MRFWRQILALALIAVVTACGSSTTFTPETIPGNPTTESPDSVAPNRSPLPGTISLPAATKQSSTEPTSTEAAPIQDSTVVGVTLTAAEIRGLTHLGIRSAVADLTARIGQTPDELRLISAEEFTWPASFLGCPQPDNFYAQVLTPGIRLILTHEGQEFDYRISGVHGLLCANEDPGPMLEHQPLEGFWARLADLPTPRSEVAAAEVDGKIYVLGGFGQGAVANEEYDPPTGTWRQRAPIPRGVDHAAAVSPDGQVYLVGGFDGRWGPIGNL